MMKAREDILTLTEAAAYLRIGERTLQRLVAAHQINYARNGRTLIFRRRDCDVYLDSQFEKSGKCVDPSYS